MMGLVMCERFGDTTSCDTEGALILHERKTRDVHISRLTKLIILNTVLLSAAHYGHANLLIICDVSFNMEIIPAMLAMSSSALFKWAGTPGSSCGPQWVVRVSLGARFYF